MDAVLILLMTCSLSVAHICDPTCVQGLCTGCLLPEAPSAFVGGTLTLNCTLVNSKKGSSSDLFFTWGHDSNLSQYQQVISDDTLQLLLPVNETLEEDAVVCWHGTDAVVASRNVTVEYPLHNVTDQQVLLNDWNNVTVSWDTGLYLHPWDISVATSWRTESEEGWHSCNVSTTTSCFITPYTSTGNLTFNITVMNTRVGDTLSMIFTTDPEDYVKPAAVTSLNASVSFNNRSVTLRWTSESSKPSLEFTVVTRNSTSVSSSNTTDKTIKVRNLRPDSRYTFTVTAVYGPAEHGHHSDPTTVDIILSDEGVLPNDPYVIIGTNLTLNCTVADTGVNPSFTYRNDEDLPGDDQWFIAANIWQLDMPVSDSSFDDETVSCWQNHPVGRQCITLEYPLHNVTDLQVLLNDWSNVTVSWDKGLYLHPGDISVATSWRAASETGWHSCSVSNSTSCFITPYTSTGNLTFNITVTNTKIGDTLSMTRTADPEDYVQPAPVAALELVNVTSRNVTLKWRHSVRDLTFTVITQSPTSNMTLTTSENQAVITNLRPYTKYDFIVSAMSATARHGYRSEPRTVSTSTNEEAPAAASSTFLAHDCIDGERNVYVFIKPPPKEFQYGMLTKYTITLLDSTVKATANYKCNKMTQCNTTGKVIVCPATTASVSLDDLNCNVDYSISVTASNRAGASPKFSQRLSKLGDVRPPTDVHSAWNGTEVTVYWTSADQPDLWTVLWCLWGPTHKTCQGDVQWITVDGAQRSAQLSMKSKPAVTRFGVSMETGKGSSGLAMSGCRYNVSAVPAKPNKTSFYIESKADLALTVRWRLDRCSPKGFITFIYIEHCVGNVPVCGGVNVSSETSHYLIADLQKDVNYTVRLRQVSDMGRIGPYSDPKFGVPIDTRLAAGIIILIVFACFLCLMVIVYISRRCCRSLYRKWVESEDIVMPELSEVRYDDADPPTITPSAPERPVPIPSPKETLGQDGNHRQTIDSGRGSLTPDAIARNAPLYQALVPTASSCFTRLRSPESTPPESTPLSAAVSEQTTLTEVEESVGTDDQNDPHDERDDGTPGLRGRNGGSGERTSGRDEDDSCGSRKVWDETSCELGDEPHSASEYDILSVYVAVAKTYEEDVKGEEEEEAEGDVLRWNEIDQNRVLPPGGATNDELAQEYESLGYECSSTKL
ncbi:leukemia inhibitory factor receptor-like [Haliotis asinina]|uniref:leukemia inhibitory factor receptor-like n=1 Tax=Haliotis asinina TaxID=109174 RepID=UPI00353256C6